MRSFATIIKRARVARGLTIEEVSRRVGAAKGYISGIEGGNVAPPSAGLILKLASVYDLDGTELLLTALAEKAPQAARRELNRRLFGAGRKVSAKSVAWRDRARIRRLARKADQVRLLLDEILEEIKGGV
jgi:transcriptional regulator with XRE-family HTH domain